MNAVFILNGQDVTDVCILNQTRIAYDTSRRISTASVTFIGTNPAEIARYDFAHYDEDVYSVDIQELYTLTILDGRDRTTKLFEGQISNIDRSNTDAEGQTTWYRCDLNDYGAFLDRAVAWGGDEIPMPISDRDLILTLIQRFCPRITPADIAQLLPVIFNFEWKGKSIRQCLDDICALSNGEWKVDYDANLHYRVATAAPPAAFGLSTIPDGVTTFPVRVDTFKRDFTNPINRCYVRGAWNPDTGVLVQAQYADPISIQTYGEYQFAIVDEQLTDTFDAELRARSQVQQFAFPVESANFVIWKDGLQAGQQVHIEEHNIGMNGSYVIRGLTMAWEDQWTVRYEAQVGASQPNLETLLRLLEQRTRWKSANQPAAIPGPPAPGSVTDESIAPGGLSAGVINSIRAEVIQGLIQAVQIGSVNAVTITGAIQSTQIGSVNAGVIVGAIQSNQIGGVSATVIQGQVQAGQIGSVNAGTIQGVIISDQLANGIIDDLAKYVDALRPVPMVTDTNTEIHPLPNPNYPPNSFFYYIPDGHFYQMTPDGMSWFLNDNVANARLKFYHIGAISANSIIGLIAAAQIGSITAGQIVGAIQAGQIGSVSASTIQGQLQSNQIGSVSAAAITGQIASTQIQSVAADKITGALTAGQIASVSAGSITGVIQGSQINNINAGTITIGLLDTDNRISRISGAKLDVGSIFSDKLTTGELLVGGGGGRPGRVNVTNQFGGSIGQIGQLFTGHYGGWFQVLGAGGTSYNDAKVRTDTSGNLFVREADFSVSGAGCTLFTSPTTFDSSYGSLALKNQDFTNTTALVTRGIVIYWGGSNIGAFARNPSAVNAVDLVLPKPGGGQILLEGLTGRCRADGGFQVSGSVGATETFIAGGIQFRFVGGIYVGH